MIELNLRDGCFQEWQQAGIISIKIAIDSIQGNNPYQFRYTIDRYILTVDWKGDDMEAWDWLFKNYIHLNKDGVIVTPFSDFFQHFGMLGTLLQVPTTRPKIGSNVKHFYGNEYGSVFFHYLSLKSIVHFNYARKLFTAKKLLTPAWLMPNCIISPHFTISFEVALASWFAFAVCSFYQGKSENYLVVPIFKDFVQVSDIKTPGVLNVKSSNVYDAAINCLINNPKAIGVKCFSYRHEKANRTNKINKIISIFRKNIDLESASKVDIFFPNRLYNKGDYTPFIKCNHVRGWLCKNICKNQALWSEMNSVELTHLRENTTGIKKFFFPQNPTDKNIEVKIEKMPTGTPSEPLVDDCDRHLLENYHWRKGKTCGWFRRFRQNGKHKTLYLHREILGVSGDQGIQVYFVNADKNDCRRQNLQSLTMSEFRKLSQR